MGSSNFSFKSRRFLYIYIYIYKEKKKPKLKAGFVMGTRKFLPLVAKNTDDGWTFSSFKPFKPLAPPNPHRAT
jgi:transposase